MRISIFGSGYVGLVQAAVFSDVGHRVICMDIDADRVERLKRGEVPFFEPGLSEMVIQGVQEGLLTFTSDTKTAVQSSSKSSEACTAGFAPATRCGNSRKLFHRQARFPKILRQPMRLPPVLGGTILMSNSFF